MEKSSWIIVVLIVVIIILIILNVFDFSIVDTSALANATINIEIVR